MLYCDVSLPVPLHREFTYLLPLTLRNRAQPGSRITVPFGPRKLTGVILRVHDDPPGAAAREALLLLDEDPVLDSELLSLGRWIAEYYCAPLGEVLRAMVPLSGELKRGKSYSLTPAGRDAARQLFLDDSADPALAVMRLLEQRSLSRAQILRKVPESGRILQSLEKKGLVAEEGHSTGFNAARAGSARLRVEFVARGEEQKLPRVQRELLAFLELHPGVHNLEEVDLLIRGASPAARALSKRGMVKLAIDTPPPPAAFEGGTPPLLNPHQQTAFAAIQAALEAKQYQTFLLQGITGSGKTEVYLRAIEAALAAGRGAILLVPEIGLTPAAAGQFLSRFGDRVAILHSAFHDAERAAAWRRIQSGQAGVVIGTRSGVFAPVRNLGLIVVDEEHDQSYKQQETPRYHGRDAAIVRARQLGACVVLGSATPSMESKYNTIRGKYTLLELPERVENRPLPEVRLVDLRTEFLETRKTAIFSRALADAIGQRLKDREQTMILLNRRGFASFAACRACGERMECPHCAVTLTYHRRDRRMLCHYCGHAARVPQQCWKCESDHLNFLGTGSEKVEEELHALFPGARVARLDRDTVGAKRDYEHVLGEFRAGRFDILVGTQMIAKGHDIANVTLVGVVNADIGLGLPDFRSAERAFQLLTQAAGRAGRGNVPGIVLIQTMNPEHYAIQAAASQDFEKFYEKELNFRRSMRYPPFAALANILVRSAERQQALERGGQLERLILPAPEGIRLLGPAEAPVPRLREEYRYQLLLKATSRPKLHQVLTRILDFARAEKWNSNSLVVDVDPMTLL
ncbi:MAG: primosomal protein N' [Bryobacteraceae bacterium]|nr:primosomal protein N' [Bryobacteraceae bacterium]